MNPFANRGLKVAESAHAEALDEVTSKLDSALTTIFSESGKKTVLYYLTNKYDLTLEQASLDPSRLEKALTNLLGELGWAVVKRAILEQFWGRRIGMDEVNVVAGASLRDAFRFIHAPGLSMSYQPF